MIAKRYVLLLLFVVFVAFAVSPLAAQNARLQLIHNSGDIDAASLEVLDNGDSLLTFSFRQATAFMDMTPGEHVFRFFASAVSDTSAPDTVNLVDGMTYVGVIGGITATNIGLGKYSNPNSRDIGMQIFVLGNAREAATDPTKVEFVTFHGSTDAPAVDLVVQSTGGVLVDNIDYGQFTAYQAVDPLLLTLDITPSDDNATVLASFEADFTALAGSSAVVFSSGFVDPESNEGAPKIGLFAALPDGQVLTFEDVTPGTPGPWQFMGASEYEFDAFIGADTLVSAGHGIEVDRQNRIWVGNFSGALRVVNPDGSEVDFSPIDSIMVGTIGITTSGCRGLALDNDGNILFARSGGDFAKIDAQTGEGLAFWAGGGSLLKPAVDGDGFIYVGLVVGINPITVLEPNFFTPQQEIVLDGAPSFGRGLEVTQDGKTIFTPDLGTSGGPVFVWKSTDLINYVKADSILNNTEGKPIFETQRTTMDWGPDSTLWVSSDNAYAAGNNDPNGFVILDFKTLEYKFLPSPEIGEGIGNGPRGVAFSATGDTAYATYFNGNRLARFIKNPTGIKDHSVNVPTGYELDQNYPNPFNPSTNIAFRIAQKGQVTLTVYNVLGQRVAKLLDKKFMNAGRHEVTFDASLLASGIYYYKLKVNGNVLTKRMTLMK